MRHFKTGSEILIVAAGLALLSSVVPRPAGGAQNPAYLGVDVREADSPEARQLGVRAAQGAVIVKVYPGYSAASFGLRAGDVVVRVDDQPVTRVADLEQIVRGSGVGKSHRFIFYRGDDLYAVRLMLAMTSTEPIQLELLRRGDRPAEERLDAANGQEPFLSLRARSAGHPEAHAAGIESPLGVAVISVVEGGPAARAGLRRGDLIVEFAGEQIQVYEDLEAAIRRAGAGRRVRAVFVRGDRRLATEVVIGARPVSVSPQWFRHGGDGYRLLLPAGWTFTPWAGGAAAAADAAHDVIESTEQSYRLFCFHKIWQAPDGEAALQQFVRDRLRDNPQADSGRFALREGAGAFVAYATGDEPRYVLYRIGIVHGGRRFVINATAPVMADTTRMPLPLLDIVERLEFLPQATDLAGPTAPSVPPGNAAGRDVPFVPSGPREAATPPAGAAAEESTGPLTEPVVEGIARVEQSTRGGFVLQALPPVVEEKAANIGPAGGTLRLADGASITVPAGALPKEERFVLRRLQSHQADAEVYHIESAAGRLRVPAEIELPVDAPAAGEFQHVELLHFRDMTDSGRALPIRWQQGEATLRAATDEFCILIKVIARGGTAAALLTEGVVRIRNLDARLLECVRTAIAKSGKGSVLLEVPYYAKGKTMWCWAAGAASLAHGARPRQDAFASPLKPQYLATSLGASVTDGLSAWRFWVGPRCEPWQTVAAFAKVPTELVETKRFWFYDNFIAYVVEQLAQGFPVLLDIRAHNHVVVLVGYDADGLYVLDNDVPASPVGHCAWTHLFAIIKDSTSQAASGLHTAVIRRAVVAESPLSLNVPSSRNQPSRGIDFNRAGCYFTIPAAKHDHLKHAGFMWSGIYPQGFGMLLATGNEHKLHLDPMDVGGDTALGYRGLEIANVRAAPQTASLRVTLCDAEDQWQTLLAEHTGLTIPGGTLGASAYFDRGQGGMLHLDAAKEIRLLPLLREDKHGPRQYLLRFDLADQQGAVDRVEIPVRLWPLRIDQVRAEPQPDGTVQYELTGTGFDRKELYPLLTMAPDRRAPLAEVAKDYADSFVAEEATSARFTLPAALIPLDVALADSRGLESNAFALGGGWFEFDIEPLKKNAWTYGLDLVPKRVLWKEGKSPTTAAEAVVEFASQVQGKRPFEIASSAGIAPSVSLQAQRRGGAYVVQGAELDRIARAYVFFYKYRIVHFTASFMDAGVQIHDEPQRSEYMKQHEKMRKDAEQMSIDLHHASMTFQPDAGRLRLRVQIKAAVTLPGENPEEFSGDFEVVGVPAAPDNASPP